MSINFHHQAGEEEEEEEFFDALEQVEEHAIIEDIKEGGANKTDLVVDINEILAKAQELKLRGNEQFGQGDWEAALLLYQEAINTFPPNTRLERGEEERAVFWGNLAACQVKLKRWEEAVKSCTKALEYQEDYHKVRLRRAQANQQLGTWAALTEAQQDYEILGKLKEYREKCEKPLLLLPGQIQQQREKETQEMLGKLKELGNSVLGKFGWSTDDFSLERKADGTMSIGINKK